MDTTLCPGGFGLGSPRGVGSRIDLGRGTEQTKGDPCKAVPCSALRRNRTNTHRQSLDVSWRPFWCKCKFKIWMGTIGKFEEVVPDGVQRQDSEGLPLYLGSGAVD